MAHFVQTDPATGRIALRDGTVYDFSPGRIEVAEEHVAEATYAIAKRLEESGKLTWIVHGPDWTGTPATIGGDESNHYVIPGVEQ